MKLGQQLFEFLEKTLTGDIQPWSAAILVTGFCPKEKLVVKYPNVTRHLLNMLSCKGLEVRHFYSSFEVSMAQFQIVPLTFNSRTGSDVFYIHSRPQCRADLVNYCIVVLGSCQHAWLTAQNFILIFQVFLKVTVLWGEKKRYCQTNTRSMTHLFLQWLNLIMHLDYFIQEFKNFCPSFKLLELLKQKTKQKSTEIILWNLDKAGVLSNNTHRL